MIVLNGNLPKTANYSDWKWTQNSSVALTPGPHVVTLCFIGNAVVRGIPNPLPRLNITRGRALGSAVATTNKKIPDQIIQQTWSTVAHSLHTVANSQLMGSQYKQALRKQYPHLNTFQNAGERGSAAVWRFGLWQRYVSVDQRRGNMHHVPAGELRVF